MDYKASTRNATSTRVRAGQMGKPLKCSGCGETVLDRRKLHAHHADYTKCEEVVWLCCSCHNELHQASNDLFDALTHRVGLDDELEADY